MCKWYMTLYPVLEAAFQRQQFSMFKGRCYTRGFPVTFGDHLQCCNCTSETASFSAAALINNSMPGAGNWNPSFSNCSYQKFVTVKKMVCKLGFGNWGGRFPDASRLEFWQSSVEKGALPKVRDRFFRYEQEHWAVRWNKMGILV